MNCQRLGIGTSSVFLKLLVDFGIIYNQVMFSGTCDMQRLQFVKYNYFFFFMIEFDF